MQRRDDVTMSGYAVFDLNISGYDPVENAGYGSLDGQGYGAPAESATDMMFAHGQYELLTNGGYTVFENAGYEQVFLDACVQLLPELEPAFLRRRMAAALAEDPGSSSSWACVAGGICIGLVQVVAGVAILIVTSGTAATASGALIGGGTSCVLYSVTAGESFQWKEFGKNLAVGLAAGAVGGGVGFKVAEAIGEGVVSTVLAGVFTGAAAGAAAGAAGSVVKQGLDYVDGTTTDGFDLVDVVLCAAKGAIIGGVVGGVSVKMGIAGYNAEAAKPEVATKAQAFARLVKRVSVGGAAGASGQMLENGFRGEPAFANVVSGLVIGASVAGTMYLLENGVRLSVRRETANATTATLEDEIQLALEQAERRIANRQRIRAYFEDEAGRRVPDSALRNTQFRPDHLHAQVATPDLVLDGVEYFHVGYRGMSQEAYEAAERNGHAPVNTGGAGGARFGDGLYVADTYEDAQGYAFLSETAETRASRAQLQRLHFQNGANRQRWQRQFVRDDGSCRTDAALRRNQQTAAWRIQFQGRGGCERLEDARLQRPRLNVARPAATTPREVRNVTPALDGAVVCDVFLPRQRQFSYVEISNNNAYVPAVHDAMDVVYADTVDQPQTRIAPQVTQHVRMFPTAQHNARLFY